MLTLLVGISTLARRATGPNHPGIRSRGRASLLHEEVALCGPMHSQVVVEVEDVKVGGRGLLRRPEEEEQPVWIHNAQKGLPYEAAGLDPEGADRPAAQVTLLWRRRSLLSW